MSFPSDDPNAPAAAVPSLGLQIAASLARQALTAAAGVLAAKGVLTSDQVDQFQSIGVALVLGLISFAWSVIQKRSARTKLKAAIVAPAAKVAP